MTILNIYKLLSTNGQTDNQPGILFVEADATADDVITPGFLTPSKIAPFSIDNQALVMVGRIGTNATNFYNVSISTDGTITLSPLSPADGSITNTDIAVNAAIDFSKLAALIGGNIVVGNSSNIAASVTMSGDATLSNVGALTIANNAVTTAKIVNSNVTLAKLASGITPSHIVKFAGKTANGGGSASIALSVTGVVSTDICFAQVQASTNAVTVQKVTPSTDTITVLLSGDPGATTTIAYQALRAAS